METRNKEIHIIDFWSHEYCYALDLYLDDQMDIPMLEALKVTKDKWIAIRSFTKEKKEYVRPGDCLLCDRFSCDYPCPVILYYQGGDCLATIDQYNEFYKDEDYDKRMKVLDYIIAELDNMIDAFQSGKIKDPDEGE